MKYLNVDNIDRNTAVRMLASNNAAFIADALLRSTFYDKDWHWVQQQCLSLLDHPSTELKGLAITCLGHLARIHRKLDLELIMEKLEPLRSYKDLSGRIDDLIDDVEIFI